MFAWANDLIRGDDAKRSVVIASMNMFSIAVYMFWSILFYNATQAPRWFKGNWAMIAMGLFLLLATIATYLLQRRQERQEAEASRRGTGVPAEKLDIDVDIKA